MPVCVSDMHEEAVSCQSVSVRGTQPSDAPTDISETQESESLQFHSEISFLQ
jgi:hypothetical protein